ncbi:monooxygenase, partial [Micromonospora globispora]
MSTPELVTLHVWRIPRAAVPRALARMALHPRRLRRTPG